MTRQSIKKSVRFEVFKRDSFTCQYCGKAAPDVVLHVDHIKPVSKGGENDLLNLITSCADCNLGKGARELSDDSIVAKQREQLEELAERHHQLQMMIEWREGMANITETKINALVDVFEENCGEELTVTESGKREMRKWLKKYDFNTLYDSIIDSCSQYDSSEKMFKMIGSIAYRKTNPITNDDPQLFYIRGILRKRLSYINEWETIDILREALDAGAPLDELTDLAKTVHTWAQFKAYIYERLGR